MLSAKLIHLIESHWDQITARVLRQIRQNPETSHMGSLSEAEQREWTEDILHNLGHWLSAEKEHEMAMRQEALGQIRFYEGVPLHEALRALSMLKRQTMDFVQEQCLAKTTLDAFAEEELERHVDSFFDVLVCHLARGYEIALRETLAPAIRAAGAG